MAWKQRTNQGQMTQEIVNARPYLYTPVDLQQMAERTMTGQGYMQYEGHYDWWFKVRLTKTVVTKMGCAFKAGDVSVAQVSDLEGERRICVFSWRNGYVDTIVRPDYVEMI